MNKQTILSHHRCGSSFWYQYLMNLSRQAKMSLVRVTMYTLHMMAKYKQIPFLRV